MRELSNTDATFSDDRVYRYALCRVWDCDGPPFVVIGLNPSTADERQDDPTIRRCIGFAKREGFGAYFMLNLFGLRATYPKVMKAHREPIGVGNDAAIARIATLPGATVVAAWGTHGAHQNRDIDVYSALQALGVDVHCFGTTKGGFPKHPLYLPNGAPLVRYTAGALVLA